MRVVGDERTDRERPVAQRTRDRCGAAQLARRSCTRAARQRACRSRGRRRIPLRARADPQAAHALGQLLRERYDQLERVPAVPASAGRALPAGPRAVPHATHESLGEVLGAGGERSSPTIARSIGSCCAAGKACRDGCSRERSGSQSAVAARRSVRRAGALGPGRVAELRPVPRSRRSCCRRSGRCPSSTTRCCSSSSTRPPSCG